MNNVIWIRIEIRPFPTSLLGSYTAIVFSFCVIHVVAHLALMVNRHLEDTRDIHNKTAPQPHEEIPAVVAMTLEAEETKASGNSRFR